MSYPKWFPRPKSWLQALVLMICITPIVVIGLAVGFITSPVVFFTEHPFLTSVWLVISATIPLWVFALIHQFLWGEPHPKLPKWIPGFKSWLESLFASIITFLIFLSIFMYCCIYLEATGDITEYRLEQLLESHSDKLSLVFIILAAYCYHLKSLIGAKFQAKRTP